MIQVPFPQFTSADNIERHQAEIYKDRGGIDCKNRDDPGFFSTVGAFAKKVAGKVLKGKFNFSSMQRPTMLSIPESHLQTLAHEYALALEYYRLAGTINDDVERMKLVVAGTIANMSYNVFRAAGKGPVNPTLGETLTVGLQGDHEHRMHDLHGTSLNGSIYNLFVCSAT